MLGYLNDPEATDLAIHVHEDGRRWVHSGDLGYRDDDGFFYFEQRIKRIIKVSGVPVFPTQIEKTLCQHEAVEFACAVAIPHPYRLHVVKAFIVLNDKTADDKTKEKVKTELQEICKRDLISYACPVEYEFRSELPLTRLGKIDYRTLEKEETASDG
jgi:Acyl-CoA synthetases (AMP-forming)/AMP-acid ligases II